MVQTHSVVRQSIELLEVALRKMSSIRALDIRLSLEQQTFRTKRSAQIRFQLAPQVKFRPGEFHPMRGSSCRQRLQSAVDGEPVPAIGLWRHSPFLRDLLEEWKRPETILRLYQRPDMATQQAALARRRAVSAAER